VTTRAGDAFLLRLEAEEWPAGEWDPADSVTDAIVTLADGSRWIAACCAFAHLATLRATCAETGENLGGRYLWASDLILVEDTRRATIEAVVRDLIARGDFASAFGQLEEDGEGEEDEARALD
jgi:hypothetical protein